MMPAVRGITLGSPGWLRAAYGRAGLLPDLAIHFDQDRGYIRGRGQSTSTGLLTTSRASTGYAETEAGVLLPFAADVPRITNKGLLIEESRTNVVLYSRDLTNAAWVKTTTTAAKDQTGVDGQAASASSLTATAGNGTCLQAVTLASSARFHTAFVKRLTGSGTVEMTMDNGATWAAISITADWSRVSIPAQTLANPTVGFRLGTSGDAIAVDFVQNEAGTFATSPIPTTTTTATRAADTVSARDFLWFISGPGTIYSEAVVPTGVTSAVAFVIYDGSTANRFQIGLSSGKSHGFIGASLSTQLSIAPGAILSAGERSKGALAFSANDGNLAAEGAIGGNDTALTLPVVTMARFGHISTINSVWNGYIRRVAYYSARLSNQQLQALTQ